MNTRIANNLRNVILAEIQDLTPSDQKEVIKTLVEDFQKLSEYL